jgi:hypothetical protein
MTEIRCHSGSRQGAGALRRATEVLRYTSKPKRPALFRAARPSRKSRRNRRESTRTGRKKPLLQAIQREPSGERPPPGRHRVAWEHFEARLPARWRWALGLLRIVKNTL